MENKNHLNEEDLVYSEAHAKELLNIQANYNKALQELNNKLAKQKSDLAVKYLKISQAQQQQAQLKAVNTQTAQKQEPKTGTVDTSGRPVNADGSPVTKESYSNILRLKPLLKEESFDTRYADEEDVEDLKKYMDAENIPYVEDEDETELDFDEEELDPEWQDELEQMGLEQMGEDDDVRTDDILDYTDDEEKGEDDQEETVDSDEPAEDEDLYDEHEDVDEKKVFYVKISDDEGNFIGKVYKLFNDGDWRAKVVKGDSKTFEKLNYDPDYDEYDIIAFLRENYDDADLISKEEFNGEIENESSEIKESLNKIPTFEEFIK